MRRSPFRFRFARRLSQLLALLALGGIANAGEWFGAIYRKRAEFAVTARAVVPRPETGSLAYVLLKAAPSTELIDEQPVNPDKELLWKATISALTQAGFTPARAADEADLAIVVVYGRGRYPPPFEFMGVDPEGLASFRWPRLLLHYDQQFHRRDYFEADVSGGLPQSFEATDADRVNFVAVRAFDARALRSRKVWTLCWETRVTVDAKNRPLEQFLPAMIAAAGSSMGKEDRSGAIVSAPIRNGTVVIGEMKVIESNVSKRAGPP